MRLATDLRTTVQAILLIESGIIIEPDFNKVCDLIDPYVNAFIELHGPDKVQHYNVEQVLQGTHLAFWIMLDESSKFPTDAVAFSELMSKCLSFATDTVENKLKFIENLPPDLSEDQLLWLSNLTQFKSENYSLIYSCLWTLLVLWVHVQKQEEFRSELAEKSKYLF